jgi:transcription-repair coupling factor (superfamily II helicase)
MLHSVLQPPIPKKIGDVLHWGQLYGAAKALAVINLATEIDGPLLLLTTNMTEAHQFYDELNFFKEDNWPIFIFPDWETLPYDHFSPHEDIISRRLQVLANLPSMKKGIVVAAVNSVMHPVMPRAYLQAHSLVFKPGDKFNALSMRESLIKVGYRLVEQVMQHGEFAFRGSIIDLFPMGADEPYRLDLLDDEIDSIRTFDPETQRSVDKLSYINLLPAKEYPLTDESISQFRNAWREQFSGNPTDSSIYTDITSGISPNGVEYYLPLFYPQCETVFNYFPDNGIIVQNENVYQAAEQFWKEVNERYDQLRHDITRPLLAPQKFFVPVEQVFSLCKQYSRVNMQTSPLELSLGKTNFSANALPSVAIQAQSSHPLARLTAVLQQTEQRVLFVAESPGRREALLTLLAAEKIQPKTINNWHSFLNGCDKQNICIGSLDQGLNSVSPNILVIAESELYGERIMQRRLRKTRKIDGDDFIRSLTELKPGMPVVHIDEGIGRYLGLQTITTAGITNDFVTIEYADNNKLYVPVANLYLLSRYTGGDAEHAPLHALGSDKWSKAKQKAAERARDVAAELLDLYARRAARQGQQCAVPDEAYQKFAAGFPFEETPDQLQAINDVINDMQKTEPMDRLVCGDVGFGKTEVAMRAAFLAVQNDYQVAVLVPTTLLAEQHYNNFKDRFADWPVHIELLSRFRSKKQVDAALDKMQAGKVDIVIGTHKLIQENVKFANLGLLIIDEEHRFGVKQKERIKALRTDVNILTLTATPIPRTLNMSLAKIRELSLIATPPAKRLSIKTFVQQRNKHIMREAILREVLRGGQVYFLHNNVQTIEKVANELAELVPEAKVGIGHGQMRERELEHVMSDFYHQRFNVLVCTTIIETGIDIPSANTIIMDRADKLGLAQLHQLRGRVGRSHHQAYAYLLIPDHKLITSDAEKRLEAIAEAGELGAGFTLATHDLEIRGAGELLGENQTGQIASVGFSLYMEFLDKAVNALKSGKQPDFNKPLIQHTEIDLSASAIIPDNYIHEVPMRLSLYKRIANADSEAALKDLQVEMIDRFGLLPDETKTLFAQTSLKLLAAELGIKKIQLGTEGGYVLFEDKPTVEPLKIIQLMQKYPQVYRLQGSNRLTIKITTSSIKSRIDFVQQLLRLLG